MSTGHQSSHWVSSTHEGFPIWFRALILVGFTTLSLLFYQAFQLDELIPWMLFVSAFPFIALGMFSILKKSWLSPLLPFLSVFFIFFTVFIDSFSARTFGAGLKTNQTSFLLSLLFAAIYFFRNLKFYMSYQQIWLSLSFFAITLLYFFVYASDFDISKVKYGYTLFITAGLEINSPPVRNIILISTLSLFVANILALSPFAEKGHIGKSMAPSSSEPLLRIPCSLLSASLLLIIACFLSKGARFNYGMHYYLPLVMLTGFALLYLVRRYHSSTQAWIIPFRLKTFLGMGLGIACLFLPLILNKTSMFGTCLSFLLFFWLTKGYGYGDFLKIILKFISQGLLTKLLIVFLVILILIISASLGVFDLFSNKIDYVVSGITSNSSMKVREGNWQYFLQEWWQTLNLQHFLFGYGIGASRKAIFYISAMRNGIHDSNLVQTLHNSYMEYLYDYGLMSLLYFGMYIHFFKKAFQTFKDRIGQDIPLAAAQLSIILYTACYGLTDGIRVQMLIQIFVLLGFLEELKQYYSKKMGFPESIDKIEPCSDNIAYS